MSALAVSTEVFNDSEVGRVKALRKPILYPNLYGATQIFVFLVILSTIESSQLPLKNPILHLRPQKIKTMKTLGNSLRECFSKTLPDHHHNCYYKYLFFSFVVLKRK